ncbi:MAG TPA: helix-turn-helix transcriptional regulator [Bacteroidia bacterium]|nr:helix-turn-helix transcriptional regulator [Bacteroidia bacterium]
METNKMNSEVKIGEKILEVLKEKHLTRAQLARAAGITPASVSYLMTRKTIDVMSLVRVSRVLKHNFLKYYYVEEETEEQGTGDKPSSANAAEGKDEKDILIEGLKEKIAALEREIDGLKREAVMKENEYLKKINSLLESMK